MGMGNFEGKGRSFVLFGQESSLLWTPERRPSADPMRLVELIFSGWVSVLNSHLYFDTVSRTTGRA